MYQKIVAAYRHTFKCDGKQFVEEVIASLRRGIFAKLLEVKKLGRVLNKRATELLAYFDRPGPSIGPTEAINGCIERPRGTALGSRNLTNRILRALPGTGGFSPLLHPLW